ncbi:Hypothetical predicted protein [Podarcis lilfordi]|uniref:Uncharacterized protein n=1 Tax=Podarcis lilfordi TaxID=74358 RepID=A0AA35PHV7_9SAUR|nr:Hypothetical predicted protein [Podarcis lilfordi]
MHICLAKEQGTDLSCSLPPPRLRLFGAAAAAISPSPGLRSGPATPGVRDGAAARPRNPRPGHGAPEGLSSCPVPRVTELPLPPEEEEEETEPGARQPRQRQSI